MTEHESAECVIVGGGIGGAVLARALARDGHPVVVLERELQPVLAARPEVLARSTIEVFHRLGVGDRIMQEAALPLRGLEAYHIGGKRLFHLSDDTFRQAGAQPYSTDPAATRRILLEQLPPAVQVMRGVEVTGLLQEAGRVVGVRAKRGQEPLTIRARLIVGDDGAHSRMREALGIPLPLQTFPLDFLTAAGPMVPGLPEAIGQVWIDPAGVRGGLFAAIFLPLPAARCAMVFLLRSAAYERFRAESPTVFYEAAARLSPRCATLAEHHRFPDGFARIQRPFGHAPRYASGRVALLGDAAHPVTPVGGQGANMSVADAAILAEAVHQALTQGDGLAQALAAYEANRRPANHRSLQFSVRAARVFRAFSAMPWLAPLGAHLLARMNQMPDLKIRFVRAISTTFASSPT